MPTYEVDVDLPAPVEVTVETTTVVRELVIEVTGPGAQGEQGPQGAYAYWWHGTQAEYEAIPEKDPEMLYVVHG